jgi:hypothetical protein
MSEPVTEFLTQEVSVSPVLPIDIQERLESRVNHIREGDNVMLKLPSDVIKNVVVKSGG